MEQKNLVLAIALSFAILLGWNLWEQSKLEDIAEQAGTQQATNAQTGGAPAPTAGSTAPVPADAVPGSISNALAPIRDVTSVLADNPRITVNSPRLRGSINLRGARFDDLTMIEYRDTIEPDSAEVVLLRPAGAFNPYFADFGWWLGDGIQSPTKDTLWTADRDMLSPESPVTLSWTNDSGLTFRQIYTIDENYMFSVTQKITNASGKDIAAAPYGLISRTGTPDILGYYILHEGLIGVFEGELQETDYEDLQEAPAEQRGTTGGWLGITDKYWLTTLIPDQSTPVKTNFLANQSGNDYRYQADFLGQTLTIAAGTTAEVKSHFFAGAKQTHMLDAYQENLGIVNFDLAIDWGWFYFLTKPIFYAIHWLNALLGNFGLAILALTVGIKLFMFPLANKSYKSMSKMKLLQPKMQELKERHGDDRQKLNQEMMELYKKEGANPMSGCLPILVQIPVFFALYKVLFVTIEMRHAPFYGWIHDLSAPDPLGLLTLFGTIDWQVPLGLAIFNIGIWPIIMGLTMYLQQKLNPAPTDPIQAKVFMFMPIMFTFLLGTFPAGLVIYWAWNNLLSIAQQWFIMRRMGVAIGGGKVKA